MTVKEVMSALMEKRQTPVSSLIVCVASDLTPRENISDVSLQQLERCQSKRK